MTPPDAAPAFLAEAGWAGARILPLAGDASFRRYFRVEHDGECAVLMDAPPPHEDVGAFLSVARYLTSHGFHAPAILAEDRVAGLLLLEDLGDARMREAVDGDPALEQPVYARAVHLLTRLHGFPAADVPPYNRAVLDREVNLFIDWWCDAAGLQVDREGWRTAWHGAFDAIPPSPAVTVLRDYHAENIMLLPGDALGLLDFQDALAGHPAYDLVSLLQDARRDVSPEIETGMRALYGGDADFDTAYAVLGAQRNAKIIGIFTRLCHRDGKPRYIDFLPRVWTYLERDLAHPALAGVKAWFDANVPADKRGAMTA